MDVDMCKCVDTILLCLRVGRVETVSYGDSEQASNGHITNLVYFRD